MLGLLKSLRLSVKVALLGAGSVLITAAALMVMAVWQSNQYHTLAQHEVDELVNADLDHITRGIYNLVQTENEAVQQQVNSNLNVARRVLAGAGGVRLSSDTVTWTANNQFTSHSTQLELPKMLIGDRWLGQNADPAIETPLIDDVAEMVGETATVFQRMNENGDMLRVATTVKTAEGRRAIGTYIPATGPDDTPNPVISAILKGNTYHGRAFVVNAWYLTAYEPIKDKAGNLLGMLYVGVSQQTIEARVRHAFLQTKVGKTGYVYAISGKGENRGCYVISQGGERDDENIWNARDNDGRYIIQSIVNKAISLQSGELGTVRYRWQNPGDREPRWKIARLVYFAPWDWVIGTSAYEDELQSYRTILSDGRVRMTNAMTAAGLAITLAVAFLGTMIASTITRPLGRMTRDMQAIVQQNLHETVEVRFRDEIGMLTDTFAFMTDRLKRAMEGLRDSEDRFRAMVEKSPLAVVVVTGSEQTITYVNPRASQLLGYTLNDVPTLADWWPLAYPDESYRRSLQAEWERRIVTALETSSPIAPIESLVTCKDGSQKTIEWGMVPLGNESIIYGINITERKRAEQALAGETRFTEALFKSLPGTVYVFDENGRFVRWNDNFRSIFGWSIEDVQTLTPLEMVSPRDRERVAQSIQQVLQTGQGAVEAALLTRNGREIPFHCTGVRLEIAGKIYVVGIGIDITERSRAEEQLRNHERALQKQNESLLSLLFHGTLFQTDLQKAVAGITEASSNLIETERVSVWLYSEDYSSIRCIDLYTRSNHEHTSGDTLHSDAFPSYTASHQRGSVIAAADVHTDPRTREIPATYFDEHGIRSLLDAPVWIHDRLGGILSFEQVGTGRSWTLDDERLAAQMAALLTLSFEAHERRRTEDALQTSAQSYRELFNASGDAIFVHDGDTGAILDVNRTMLEMFRCSREEAMALTMNDISEGSPPYSQDDAVRWLRAAITDGPQMVEWRCRRTNGELFWAEVSLRSYRIGDRRRVLATVRDISARKAAEQALHESDERLKLAMEVAQAGIWEFNLRSNRVFVDQTILQNIGLRRGEEPQALADWRALTHPEDRPRQEEAMQAYLQGHASAYMVESRTKHREGHYVWSYMRGRVTERAADGSPCRMIGISIDITERKRAEMALWREKQFSEKLLESLPGIFFLYDSSCHLKRWNKAHETAMGFTADELRDRYIPDWHETPEEAAVGMAMVKSVLETGVGGAFETTLINKAGQFVPYLISITRLMTPDGPAMMGVGIDITERKRAEEALRESQRQLLDIAANIPGVIYQFIARADGTFEVSYLSERAKELFGIENRLEGHFERFTACIADMDRDRFLKSVRQAVHTEQPWEFEGRFHKPSGETLWISGRSVPLRRGDDQVFNGVLLDITERKCMEEALRESEERFRGFAAASRYGFGMGRLTGEVIYGNRAILQIVEEDTEAEFISNTVFQYYTAENAEYLRTEILPVVLRDGHWAGEIPILSARGCLKPTEQVIFLICDQDGTPTLMGNIVTDITDRKRAEDELARYRDHLEELVQQRTREVETAREQARQADRLASMGTFAAGMAHEINNPLGIMMLGTDQALANMDKPDLVRRLLRQNVEMIERCGHIVGRVLDFSRKKSTGKQTLNLNDVIGNGLGFVRESAARHGVAIETLLATTRSSILGNTVELAQVVVNLVQNAIQACAAGGHVTIETCEADETVQLTVQDDGCGMSPEQMRHVFDPFYTTRQTRGGTGLGLSVVHGIVTDHQGTITVASEEGRGTTFTVTFNRHTDTATGDAKPS